MTDKCLFKYNYRFLQETQTLIIEINEWIYNVFVEFILYEGSFTPGEWT